ncbi:MAG: HEAT repeat domain-containing protein [Methanomicrobiales archaeon]
MNDSKKGVRKNPVWALGKISDELVVEGITALINDPDEDVREAVRKALASIVRANLKKCSDVPIIE